MFRSKAASAAVLLAVTASVAAAPFVEVTPADGRHYRVMRPGEPECSTFRLERIGRELRVHCNRELAIWGRWIDAYQQCQYGVRAREDGAGNVYVGCK